MAKFRTISYSVLDETVSQSLLLRSTSSKRSVCTCGNTFHEQSVIELVPEKLFTFQPTKLLSFAEKLVHSLSNAWVDVGHTSDRVPPFCCFPEATVRADGRQNIWWNELVTSNKLTPFQHIWSTLIQFADLFSCHSSNGLCYGINFCHSDTSVTRCSACQDHSACQGRGVRLMLGSLSSPLADTIVSAWSPCSRTFALQLVMSWAKRLIELDEKNEPDSEKLHSNLARASYGVLENWVDMILLNKLGPYASNSVQIEPDPPSFFEEPLCPIGPSAQTVTPRLKETVIRKTEAMVQKAFDDQEKITPLTIILKDSKNSLDAAALSAFPNEWRELDLAWDHVIHKRLTAEPEASHTLIVDLNGTDESAEHRLPQLVHQIGQFARRFCPTSA